MPGMRLACTNVPRPETMPYVASTNMFRPLWWLAVRQQYRALNKASDVEKLLYAPVDDFSCFPQNKECLLHVSQDLGPWARWLVGCKVIWLMLHPQSSWDDLLAHRKPHDDLGTEIKARGGTSALVGFDKWFRDKSPATKAARYSLQGEEWATGEAILDALNDVVAAQRGSRIDSAEFLKHRNGGDWRNERESPLFRFESWLLNGVASARSSLAGLEAEYFFPTTGRREQLDDVVRRLTDERSHHPVVNLHAIGQWTGLRAFVSAVVDVLISSARKSGSGPSILYLRISNDGADQRPTTRAGVLKKLCDAFDLQAPAHSEADPRVNLDNDLRALRKALTLHPTIVCLDAVPVSAGPLGAVEEGMRNAQWVDFIRVLVQPDFETYRDQGACYRSRFLILSSAALQGLGPWCDDLPLQPVGRNVLRELYAPTAETRSALAALRSRLGVSDTFVGLPELYSLTPAAVDALVAEAGDEVSEVELALASLLAASEPQNAVVGHEVADALLQQRLFADWYERTAERVPRAILMMQFVACSFNGMRLDTLERSLRLWARLAPVLCEDVYPPKLVRQELRPDDVTRLLGEFRQILVSRQDEPTEALGVLQRAHELQPTPAGRSVWQGTAGVPPSLGATVVEDGALLIDLRFDELRGLFFRQMLSGVRGSATGISGWAHAPDAWNLVQRVLAEESLKQATAQVRNLPASELLRVDAQRRFVQAAAHGLLGLEPDVGGPAPAIEGLAMPPESSKRFRYLFQFVFKHCIENAPEWQLTRAYGRSPLRLALLRLYADPAFGRDLVAGRRTPQVGDGDLITLVTGLRPAGVTREMHSEILQALGRAAYDVGDHDAVRCIAAALTDGELTNRPAPTGWSANSGAPVDDGDSWVPALDRLELATRDLRRVLADRHRTAGHRRVATAACKLLVDTHLVLEDTDKARPLAAALLHELGVDPVLFERLGRASELGRASAPSVAHKLVLEAHLTRLVDLVFDRVRLRAARVAVSDMLARLAEMVTIEVGREPQAPESVGGMLDAYALYWIADRVRSGSADDSEGAWAIASSRSMRFYVRVALKLARLFADASASRQASSSLAKEFFIHARTKLDVYTRHLHRLPRERQAMQLLMASAARVWAEISENSESTETCKRYLLDSLAYIAQAEHIMCELGMGGSVIKRFYFERCKTMRRLAKFDPAGATVWIRMARDDFERLEAMSPGSPFWTRMVARRMSFVATAA